MSNTWHGHLNISGNNWQVWYLPLLVFAGITSLLAIAFYNLDLMNYWEGWALGPAGQFEEFCERNRMDELIREPANTWSNLAFVLYGLFCLAFGITDLKNTNNYPPNLITAFPSFSILMGLSLVYLGFGSFFYHASLTSLAQQWDMGGSYAVLALPIMFNLYRISYHYNKSKGPSYLKEVMARLFLFLTIIVDVLFFIYKWDIKGTIMLPAMIVTILVTTIIYHRISQTRYSLFWGLLGLFSIITAFTIWQLDVKKIWCNPDSLLQGHAIWHVLTGLSAFSIYLLLRSEKPAT